MSDPSHLQSHLPPPAPPLPPSRLGPLQRLIAPLGLTRTSRALDEHASRSERPPLLRATTRNTGYGDLPSQTAAHRTGIPIIALDINAEKTHAILAGKEILKTVRIQDGKVSEDFNLRTSIISYASMQGSPQGDAIARRREYLPARDVKWSVGKYSHIVATAASNGRIALYDVNVAGSRTELAWLHEHTGQVNKLDFDPFAGYLLLSASQDKTVRTWDIREARATRSTQRYEVRSPVRHVRWSPVEGNDFDIAVCADQGLIQNWDARNNKLPKLSIHAHDKGCYSLDWHPDGRHVVSAGFDKYVRVWDFKGERRQKPVFQFRAPQAVRKVKWRPPCWSSETTESGAWQTTQIATTYHFDDPRMHVWDLRRPLIPFREIDMYNRPATDFLWATKDLIWTCGEEGMFTQNDVNFATQVHHAIPPTSLQWRADGECIIFSEERNRRRTSRPDDPSAAFLSVAPEKLSGEDEVSLHQDLEDDDYDGAPVESLLSTSFKRHPGRSIPTRSMSSAAINSHATSPRTPENPNTVLQLDKSVRYSSEPFENNQIGATGYIPGAADDPDAVEFAAKFYAPPALERERRESPSLILERLQQCFLRNAEVCDEASLHRTAQSWRILESIIVPELSEWAGNNKSSRWSEAAKTRERREKERSKVRGSSIQSFSKLQARNTEATADTRPNKLISNLFKGVVDSERSTHSSENGSTSNVTTPLARPLSASSQHHRTGHKSNDSADSNEGIDSLQALPPSLLNSHATAAAAARALADTASIASSTPPTSPEHQRTRSGKQSPQGSMSGSAKLQTPEMILERSPLTNAQKQEEKRAALRDYRIQARPIFTLDTPVRSPNYNRDNRYDSAESFPMFSASTSSSQKARSLGQSFEHAEDLPRPPQRARPLPNREDSMASISSVDEDDSPPKANSVRVRDFSDSPSTANSERPNEPVVNSGFETSARSKDHSPPPATASLSDDKDAAADHSSIQHSAISSSPDMFQFDASYSPVQAKIHITNPIRKQDQTQGRRDRRTSTEKLDLLQEKSPESADYIFSDFRPIDLTQYEPRLPFALSALPLICQMVAYDVDSGFAHGQFAAHLLLYIAPYFFHRDFQIPSSASLPWPKSLAERLMRPDLSHRIIESILVQHTCFLRQMQLYQSLAAVRKVCSELGYEGVLSIGHSESKGSSSSSGDSYLVPSTCSYCRTPWKKGENICDHCKKVRAMCAVCHQLEAPHGLGSNKLVSKRLGWSWSYCQACSHGAHQTCMEEWLWDASSEGLCPTVGCGCDCAPGTAREERIEQQARAQEEDRLIRGNAGVTKKDPFRAIQSPAVDKTRAALRAASGDRGTQSSDERGVSARRSSTRRSVGGFANSRKSVRLVTPGEETDSVIVERP